MLCSQSSYLQLSLITLVVWVSECTASCTLRAASQGAALRLLLLQLDIYTLFKEVFQLWGELGQYTGKWPSCHAAHRASHLLAGLGWLTASLHETVVPARCRRHWRAGWAVVLGGQDAIGLAL